MKSIVLIVALASCIATAASHAASSPQVPDAFLACSKLEDAGERVRCYDAQVAAMNRSAGSHSAAPAARVAQPTPPPTSVPAAAPIAPTPPSAAPPPSVAQRQAPAAPSATPAQPPEATFGEEYLPQRARPVRSDAANSLTSSISAIRELRPNVYLFALANGQVWEHEGTQDGTRTAVFFRAGDDVHIEKHLLGSYHMWTASVGAKNWVRVTRIR